MTGGADAAASEGERVFWEAVGKRPRDGEGGGGDGGVASFVRVGEDERLDNF